MMMGVKVGPDGHIWCVNRTESKVYRLDVAAPQQDVAVISINSPELESYLPSFYSNAFDALSYLHLLIYFYNKSLTI